MTCSKILLGDLPELMYKVINYLQNDLSTLHSCILVNRLWCRLAIPLLWENPFSIHTENYNFIEIYLRSLNDDFITNKYTIINKSSHSNILFNYPRFLKYLNTNEFIFSVDKWSKLVTITTNSEDIVTDLKKLTDICVSLFKIFIENEVNLHTFEIVLPNNYYQTCFGIILDELILKNTNFIHNIRNLNLYNVYDYEENSVIRDRISPMINLQQNLKKISISYRFSWYRSLLLSKDYNCSNTLNTIIFYYVDFKGINNLKTVIEQLNVLESIHIFYCSSFIQQIIDLTKPFKLKSLFLNELSQIESYQIINLIENIKQNLNYLSLNICSQSSMILQILGQTLPSKLEYLCLNLFKIKVNDFEVFLKNSMGTFIKKLLIFNNLGQDILPLIKTYIMKKKRVKYLAINNESLYTMNNFKELFSLEDEVNEFKLYNIEVQSYSGLSIHSCNYIKEFN